VKRRHVVILGGGFAGTSLARRLERHAELAVTLVDRDNYTLFTPMLPEVASGGIEPRHIAQPLRVSLRKTSCEMARVGGVDFEKRIVSLDGGLAGRPTTLCYDELVLALGAESSTHGVPGAAEHTFALATISDAIALRDQTIRAMETAAPSSDRGQRNSALTFAIVGGGFNGVETAGELNGYLQAIRRFYPSVGREDIRVVLIAGSDRLLEQLPARFGERAQQMLEGRGIEVVMRDPVASVDADGLTLHSGARYDSRTVVWSAGMRPSPSLETFDLPLNERHAVRVDADLSVPDRPGVWALGDCADIPQTGGGSVPHTAQAARAEGPLLARNILAKLHARPTRAYARRSLGMMASLGHREGLVEFAPGIMLTGLPAWLIWRTYYLSILPGRTRKTRVALDWTLASFFRPDIAEIR
jgi:NADH dehydrogenase